MSISKYFKWATVSFGVELREMRREARDLIRPSDRTFRKLYYQKPWLREAGESISEFVGRKKNEYETW